MKQTKVDSVQNFLTPSKLLTSKMRQNNKPKPASTSLHQSLANTNPNDSGVNNTWASPSTPRREL